MSANTNMHVYLCLQIVLMGQLVNSHSMCTTGTTIKQLPMYWVFKHLLNLDHKYCFLNIHFHNASMQYDKYLVHTLCVSVYVMCIIGGVAIEVST